MRCLCSRRTVSHQGCPVSVCITTEVCIQGLAATPPLIHSARNSTYSSRAIKDGEAVVRTVKVTDGQVNGIVGLRPCPSRKITATCGWVRAVTNGEETRI